MEESTEENKLEEVLEGVCPSCKEETEFDYIGKQKTKEKPIELYICGSCESSIAYQSIMDVNPNLKKSSQ